MDRRRHTCCPAAHPHRDAPFVPVGERPAVPDSAPVAEGFPYLVVRLMAGVYQREEIAIRVGEPHVEVGFRSSYVRHPEPFTATGEISPGCRELLVRAVLAAVQKGRFRMCLVWARDACTFCERDGTTLDSNQPPSGGFGSGGIGGTPLPVNVRFDRDPESGSSDGGEGHA